MNWALLSHIPIGSDSIGCAPVWSCITQDRLGEIMHTAHLHVHWIDFVVVPIRFQFMTQGHHTCTNILHRHDTHAHTTNKHTHINFHIWYKGLAGSTHLENTELFSIVDAAADAWFKIYDAVFLEKDETRRVTWCKVCLFQYTLILSFTGSIYRQCWWRSCMRSIFQITWADLREGQLQTVHVKGGYGETR